MRIGRECCDATLSRSWSKSTTTQDKGAAERGEFYLDGPEKDEVAFDTGHLSMNPRTTASTPAAADPTEVDSECTPMPIESQLTRGAWTRAIDELCRALETQ